MGELFLSGNVKVAEGIWAVLYIGDTSCWNIDFLADWFFGTSAQ